MSQQFTPVQPLPAQKPVTVIPCTFQVIPPSTPAKKIPCNYATVTVDKPDRKYTLTVDKNTPSEEKVLEIVAGFLSKSAKVTVKTTGVVTCDTHKTKVFDFSEPVSKKDAQLEFTAKSFFHNPFSILPLYSKINEYTIPINTCDHKQNIRIKVYPDISYNFKFELVASKEAIQEKGSKHESGMELAISGAHIQDGVTSKMGLEYKFSQIVKAIEAGNAVAKRIESYSKMLKAGVEIEYSMGNVSLDFGWNWEEIPKSPKCGLAYKLNIKSSPLFSIKFSFDIIGWLLQSIPAIGTFVKKLKDYLEAEKMAELKCTISLTGSINFNKIAISKVATKKPAVDAMDIQGEIKIGVEAGLSAKFGADYWMVNTSGEAGIEASAEAALGLGGKISCKDEEASLILYATFGGLVLQGSAYVKANMGTLSWKEKLSLDTTMLKPEKDFELVNLKLS